ncbi:MAG: UDP-N-acetylmuramate dehydrogenase [Bacteroidia bacterium]|jgi:UDP-N-acetylmuramate dehydrogenase|nr:UDP-N-acetylmuramate dehydrogenase [Bacteroidia bacterium]
MPQILKQYNLKHLNTFGIEAYCDNYAEIHSFEEFKQLMATKEYTTSKKLILGGGSNLLFVSDFKGLVIRNCLKGISLVKAYDDEILVKAAAGENWHGFVMWCIQQGYAGLENLSLIPGCVGASPMQNIGAYGVEIKDVFEELEACHMSTGELRVFSKNECHFGYRESVFKREFKEVYFITSVTFRLSKLEKLNTSYGAISLELEKMGVKKAGIKDVSEAVIHIRQSKLPDPKQMGNAGSFFKNPEVSAEQYAALKARYPELVAYALENGNFKLAAGWLIEQCGLKGLEMNGAAVHDKQALVLVNKGKCSGKDIYELSEHVLNVVNDVFGVRLEREVNIIG